MSGAFDHHNQDATVYVGNLDERVDEELIWELFLQFGPVVSVSMPKDKVTNTHQGFGFVEFQNEIDAEYAVRVTGNVALYGKKIRVNKANMDKKTLDVGANLFISNLAPEVDEDALKTTFMAFGQFACEPKIARDPETNISTPMQPGVMGAPMQPGMMGAPMQPGMMSTPMQPGMVGTPMQPGVMGAPMMGGMAPIQ
ncbi:hypothetical protein JH06_0838 [Blastocystis sp. subtype 4]|uniref:hypothetical protein n=1 Tax=Blastocystis sp. subtype 4 TaxID=944170 RepID=UPI000711CB07|nr:hypothetical protein JH06_0838 [Blastocystis sp. subtype 4]KNB46332.1 hypothetical protein JH06_0838 [Blastocystis sp. subtype 4]|eukprot:XP_014529773.1 hypothetical protein JH06_0838 [Blastocystis sp. subtype 4]